MDLQSKMDLQSNLVCRCGFVHKDNKFIDYRRNSVSNQVKLFCQKCGKRLFLEYVTTSSREFREILLNSDSRFRNLNTKVKN